MLSHLAFLLLFEPIEPSYGTFLGLLPASVITPPVLEIQMESPNLRIGHSPVKKSGSITPAIGAKAIFSVDLASGAPLLMQNIFNRSPIASIEKLMTAMVILDNHKLSEKVTVSKNAAGQEGSQMGLKAGEEITVENLLAGMLINSGNDAAVALAEYDAGNENSFVTKMNKKAQMLGLHDTFFSNAKGFDEDDNYSTAFDTMIFSRAALSYPFIKKTAGVKTTEVSSANGKIKHRLENTNELLKDTHFQIIGLKTGRTPAAGQSLVSLAKAPNGHEMLTVVLDSPDRFKETRIVIDWVLRNFEFP